MFNKSALLITICAAFAVALPTGSTPKGPSTLHGVHVLGVSIPSVSDVDTPSTNQIGIADVHKEIREVAHPSFQLPEVEEEKAPTIPKDTLSTLAVSLPRDEPLLTDEHPKVDTLSASVLKNPAVELPKVLRSIMPSLPRKSKNKSNSDESETPDASTLRPPSGSASISWNYARAQLNNTVLQPNNTVTQLNSTVSQLNSTVSQLNSTVSQLNSTVSQLKRTVSQPNNTTPEHMQSTIGGAGKVAMIKGNLPREHHIPGVHMPSVPSTPELTQSSPPKDLLSSNVKSPSLARRAESCSSDYTLTYCRQVLQSDDSFVPTLLHAINVDSTSVSGPVGLSCSPAKTTDYVYPLCSKKMDVAGLALDCVAAILNVVA